MVPSALKLGFGLGLGVLAGALAFLSLGAGCGTDGSGGAIPVTDEPGASSIPELASAAEFKSKVEDAKGVVLVDFHAQWCGWCRKQAPVLEKLAGDYQGKVSFVKVDTDALQDVAGRYKVEGLPTMIVFKNGSPVETLVGYREEASLKKVLDKVLGG